MSMTKADVSEFMREMGRRGGKIGGKRCLETMTAAERSARALKAVSARWAKPVNARPAPLVGDAFAVRMNGEVSTGWIVTQITPGYVYFYKPEYDGTNRRARRQRTASFAADVDAGIIRKERR